MPFTLLEELPECRLGHIGSVYVTVWFNEVSMRSLDALELHHKTLSERYGKVTFISVASSATKTPSAEIRERLRRDAPKMTPLRHANIVAVTAKGLGAIITRSFLAALNLMSAEKMIIVSSLEDAASAARELPGQDASTRADAQLGEALAAFVALPRPSAKRAAGE